MIMEALIWVGGKAAGKVFDVIKDKVLGIEYQQVSVEDWAKTAALAIFAGQSLRPELSFEKKAEIRFNELQKQIDEVKQDLNELRLDMAAFEWRVTTLFYASREEDLWQEMLNLDSTLDSYYKQLKELGESDDTPEEKRKDALKLAGSIVTNLGADVDKTRMRFLGKDVGTGSERVRGFLEIWREQALRDADKGWDNQRLAKVYGLLESKFTRALLIQLKCVRLLMEAQQTLFFEKKSKTDAINYYSKEFFPVLRGEVDGFRDVIESLAVNITPLPTGSLLPLKIPSEVEGMFAALDVFTSQALGGKITNEAAGASLPEAPAISGAWGRVVVPSTRWIRRAPGAKEDARATVTTPSGQKASVKGTLEVRSVKFTPYENDKKEMVHKGYQIQVGNDLRDMNTVLVAHFTPSEVLPGGLVGNDPSKPTQVDLALETGDGKEVLAQTKAYVIPVKVGDSETLTVPYGTFTMSFTGGAGVRAK